MYLCMHVVSPIREERMQNCRLHDMFYDAEPLYRNLLFFCEMYRNLLE
jgi:hypothetical protein